MDDESVKGGSRLVGGVTGGRGEELKVFIRLRGCKRPLHSLSKGCFEARLVKLGLCKF